MPGINLGLETKRAMVASVRRPMPRIPSKHKSDADVRAADQAKWEIKLERSVAAAVLV